MLSRYFLKAALASAAMAACASTPKVNPGSQPGSDRTAAVLVSANRWTGTLSPTQSFKAAAVSTERQKAYGTVELTASSPRGTLTHVRLIVSVPMEPGMNSLGWAIHQGSCGSGNPPLLAPAEFPMIVVSGDGRGSIEGNIGFTLPESGSYHVNVFRGNGTQLNDVLTCANLRRQN